MTCNSSREEKNIALNLFHWYLLKCVMFIMEHRLVYGKIFMLKINKQQKMTMYNKEEKKTIKLNNVTVYTKSYKLREPKWLP